MRVRLTPTPGVREHDGVAQSFTAELQPVPHGGHYVVVPRAVAEAAGLKHGLRVRGTVNGARYRSSLMMYGGMFHLGVHKATLAAADVKAPAVVHGQHRGGRRAAADRRRSAGLGSCAEADIDGRRRAGSACVHP